MDDDGSTEKLLFSGDSSRSNNFRLQKLQQNRSASALFFGVVFGFIFSFFFAYSGYLDEQNSRFDYSVYEVTNANTLNDTAEIVENTNLAEFLQKKIRVMCIVMTNEGGLNSSAEIIMDTWGKRCTRTLFFSNKVPALNLTNIVTLHETDSFAQLREAYKYVYMNHHNEFDWILKTNDNSYMVLENLRHLLYQYESDWPLIIGQRTLKEDYMLGVFVLSKRAFTRLLEDAFTNTDICEVKGNDDKEVMKCLEHINVIKVDGIDRDGRGMFFRNSPESLLFPERYDDSDHWYWRKFKQGVENCCSDRLICIQNVFGTHLYYMEYYIYKVHAFGRHRNPEPLPDKFSLEEVIKTNY